MNYKEQYEFWLKDSYFDEETKKELQEIQERKVPEQDEESQTHML